MQPGLACRQYFLSNVYVVETIIEFFYNTTLNFFSYLLLLLPFMENIFFFCLLQAVKPLRLYHCSLVYCSPSGPCKVASVTPHVIEIFLCLKKHSACSLLLPIKSSHILILRNTHASAHIHSSVTGL